MFSVRLNSCFAGMMADSAKEALQLVLARDALLVSGANRCHPPVAATLDIPHESINAAAGERVRGTLHIQTTNSRHSRIKGFRSITTDLDSYFRWFHLIELGEKPSPGACLDAAMAKPCLRFANRTFDSHDCGNSAPRIDFMRQSGNKLRQIQTPRGDVVNSDRRIADDAGATVPQERHFVFVLQPEFPVNAFILATEVLRIVNQNSGQELVRWMCISSNGQPVRSSNGMWFDADRSLADMPEAANIVLFEGNLPTQENSPELLGALRAAHRHGVRLLAVDTAAFAFAQAGLIGDHPLVLHWEAVPAFLEHHPGANIRNRLYQWNGAIGFCAGGVAILDMMLDLVAELFGQSLADEVSNALVHSPRPAGTAQRLDDADDAVHSSLSRRMVAIMEQNLDFPLAVGALADRLGISIRSLQRHCRRHFQQTPMQVYLRIRLQVARNLLFYEERSVKEIATTCGFSYTQVFSRAFKRQFGQPPSAFRASFRNRQQHVIRPEISRLAEDRRVAVR